MKTKINAPQINRTGVTRRHFLRGTAGAAAGLALGGLPSALAAPRNKILPAPNRSGIEHVVVVMMENRSFDHFLGWLPGAEGKQAGLAFEDAAGVVHSTYRLSEFQGCGYSDPYHSWAGGRVEYDKVQSDGWTSAGC